jgi:hypothetical protein
MLFGHECHANAIKGGDGYAFYITDDRQAGDPERSGISAPS